jgi:RimJ/RimL family protein N-acetyltransferase
LKLGNIEVIASLKKTTFTAARGVAVQVVDADGVVVGCLVPVGEWILQDGSSVEAIRAWRQRAMRMFLTQFQSTVEKTFRYLREFSIARENRLLFLIYDRDGLLVGHLGVSDVDGSSGELDNLMRGTPGGHRDLVYFSELALIDWCFQVLKIDRLHLRALSYNGLALELHERVGFETMARLPLRKVGSDDLTVYQVCSEQEASVAYRCVLMELTISRFYLINSKLARED